LIEEEVVNFKNLIKYANLMDEKGYTVAANAIDMACKDSNGNYDRAIQSLTAFALLLDADGFTEEADFLDIMLSVPGMSKNAELADTSSKYDYQAHRKDTLFDALIREHTKTEPDMQHMRGENPTLLTRYSPDYPGVMMQRISDGVYQDLLSKKVYDFNAGFISDTGIRYHGGSVAHQTPDVSSLLGSNFRFESRQLSSRPQ
jgi:hypothetical protein